MKTDAHDALAATMVKTSMTVKKMAEGFKQADIAETMDRPDSKQLSMTQITMRAALMHSTQIAVLTKGLLLLINETRNVRNQLVEIDEAIRDHRESMLSCSGDLDTNLNEITHNLKLAVIA